MNRPINHLAPLDSLRVIGKAVALKVAPEGCMHTDDQDIEF